jgi:hypothetical protein
VTVPLRLRKLLVPENVKKSEHAASTKINKGLEANELSFHSPPEPHTGPDVPMSGHANQSPPPVVYAGTGW